MHGISCLVTHKISNHSFWSVAMHFHSILDQTRNKTKITFSLSIVQQEFLSQFGHFVSKWIPTGQGQGHHETIVIMCHHHCYPLIGMALLSLLLKQYGMLVSLFPFCLLFLFLLLLWQSVWLQQMECLKRRIVVIRLDKWLI